MTKIIGLTGGIGSGKSTIVKFFSELEVPVYIADDQAKKIMDYPKTINEVQNIFEEKVIFENGKLDRKKIASIVFNDSNKLAQLNEIIHPKVKKDFSDWLEKHKQHNYIIKEVAILFETKSESEFDKIILVIAPEKDRIERVMKRDKITESEVLERIKNQLPDTEKIQKSDFIINNTNINTAKKQVKKIHSLINSL